MEYHCDFSPKTASISYTLLHRQVKMELMGMRGAWEELDNPAWTKTDKDIEEAVEAYFIHHFHQLT